MTTALYLTLLLEALKLKQRASSIIYLLEYSKISLAFLPSSLEDPSVGRIHSSQLSSSVNMFGRFARVFFTLLSIGS